MSDIVERLRVLASGRAIYSNGHIAENYYPMQAMGEAADEINRLREALEEIAKEHSLAGGIARAALAKETGQSPADKWEEEIQ